MECRLQLTPLGLEGAGIDDRRARLTSDEHDEVDVVRGADLLRARQAGAVDIAALEEGLRLPAGDVVESEVPPVGAVVLDRNRAISSSRDVTSASSSVNRRSSLSNRSSFVAGVVCATMLDAGLPVWSVVIVVVCVPPSVPSPRNLAAGAGLATPEAPLPDPLPAQTACGEGEKGRVLTASAGALSPARPFARSSRRRATPPPTSGEGLDATRSG